MSRVIPSVSKKQPGTVEKQSAFALSRRSLGMSTAAASLLSALPLRGARADASLPALGWPALFAEIPFGTNSYYLQPWRDMVATRALASYENGFGIQNADLSSPASLAMLAANGFTQLRIGIPWGAFSYAAPGTLTADVSSQLTPFIEAAQAAGMRCLILIQAFDQAPCPYTTSIVQLAGALGPSDTTMTLSSTAGFIAGFSGPTSVIGNGVLINFDYANAKMCPAFFTAINGQTVTLSKPLGYTLPSGTMIVCNTLLAKPFAQVGSADYEATMSGWLAYVDAVSAYMSSVLGTTGHADIGFDLEIWNELTFGSGFLDINNYSATPLYQAAAAEFPPAATDIVARTAARAGAKPALYAGVRIADGFSSVVPGPASSTEPAGISALTKHFYPSPASFPSANVSLAALDVSGNVTSFVPSCTLYLHELPSTAIPVYGVARDATTETNMTGNVARGVDARVIGGAVAPVTVWMTETGTATTAVGVTDPGEAAIIQTKGLLRSLFFNIGIGVERVYVFQGVGDTTQFALVPEAAPTTPTLPIQSLGRALAFIRGGVVSNVAGPLKQYQFQGMMFYNQGQTLFSGNGTAACPDFVQPADCVVLPIQVSPTRTAFCVYFHAADMRKTMAPVYIALRIIGFNGVGATLTAYDPVMNYTMDSGIYYAAATETWVVIAGACDYPCFFVLDSTG